MHHIIHSLLLLKLQLNKTNVVTPFYIDSGKSNRVQQVCLMFQSSKAINKRCGSNDDLLSGLHQAVPI